MNPKMGQEAAEFGDVSPVPVFPVPGGVEGSETDSVEATSAKRANANPDGEAVDDSQDNMAGDAFVAGVSLMLVLTVVQRAVGFLRNVMVCRLMDPADLGMWNLGETMLFLCAPLLVLGVPGTLNRYVEHYRQKGQLRSFLIRVAILSSVLAIVGALVMALCHEWVRRVAFGNADAAYFFAATLVTLVIVIAFNFMNELLMAMRQVKALAYVNFANSTMFAVLAIGLLSFTTLKATGVVVAYGIACVVTIIFAFAFLGPVRRTVAASNVPLAHSSLWAKILPYAGWLWLADLLDNTFNAVDRYMIVHFSGAEVDSVALVGQYHCSRILGVLLISVATMLANVLVPYLTHDWEKNRRRAVSAKMNLGIKTIGLAMVLASAAVIIMGPAIFNWILDGKYAEGFEVLPCTMTYCIWFGLMLFGQSYLYCGEKVSLRAIAIAVGLVANVVFNALLLPRFGLAGAVWATAIANLITLALVYFACNRQGMYITKGVWIVVLMPLCLVLPTLWSVISIVAIASVAFATGSLFTRWETRMIGNAITAAQAKIFSRFGAGAS